MVDLLVYTNHRMGDMYYNTPFPHNVLSIVTVLIFFWGRLFSGSRCSRLSIGEIVISEVVVHHKVGSKSRCKEKGFVLDPVYVWQRCLLDSGTKPKETGILFLERSGFLGIAAHTLKELVILQFRKCLSENIVQIHLWSIVDTKFVGNSTVCVQIRLWRFRKCSIRFRCNM